MKKKIILSILTMAMMLSIRPIDSCASELRFRAYGDLNTIISQKNHTEENVLVKPQIDEEPSIATMSVMPMSTNEAEIVGGTQYTTLESAVTAATTGQTIKLLADVELELALSITQTMTLDLNGFDIKQTGSNKRVITVTGNLTLEDNGSRATRYGYWDTTYKISDTIPSSFDYTELQGGVIYGGSSSIGGGVYFDSGATFTMDGGTISGNTATSYGSGGGGVYFTGSTFTMNDGTISANKAIYGGGVYVNSSTFEMTGGTVESNTATYNGGGVYVGSNGSVTMKGGILSSNEANTNGGGVYVANGTFAMTSGTLSGNTATTGKRIYLVGTSATFFLKISNTLTSSIKGALHTDDDDNYNMMVRSDNTSITIDGGAATTKNAGDIAYFTGTTWTFDPSYVAETGGTQYITLEAAVTAAAGSGTVTLLKDVEISSALSISKTMTIDLNGFDIKQIGTESVITIASGGNLTLEDSNPSRKISYGYWDASDTYVITDDLSSIPVDTYYTTLKGGIIRGGSATSGGGVYASGSTTFTMNSGNIAGNSATNGGGVYFSSSGKTFTMTGGSIVGNKATSSGGGVNAYIGTFKMSDDATIENNLASSLGGGLYILMASVEMSGGTISYNKATSSNAILGNGGGICVANSGGSFKISGDVTIENNTASSNGNKIYLATNTSLELETAKITGALNIDDDTSFDATVRTNVSETITIDGTEYTGKVNGDIAYFTGTTWTFDPPEAEIDGTIYFDLEEAVEKADAGDTITLLADVELESALSITKQVTIGLNGYDIKQTGSNQSVISITSSGNLTLNDSNPNSRTRYGYWDTTYKISDTAPSSFHYVELQGGIIYGGSSPMGGGVYVASSAAFVMNSGNIAGNTAPIGGGVFVNSGSFEMNGGTIAGNTAYTSDGGGVYVTGSIATLAMKAGTISTNSAKNNGGGVYVNSGTFTMDDATIEKNEATNGGGVYVTSLSATFTMNGTSTISGNTATDGGGVYVSTGTFEMVGGTLFGNTATTGNRIYLYGTSATLILKTSSMSSYATIIGAVYTNDNDNYNMMVRTAGNITIYNGTSVTTTQSFGDIAYFTGETWTFDPPEAEINGTSYFTLEEAVEKADAGDTITLLVDVELEEALSIEKQVTIDLNGYDIKQTGEYSVISISSSGNLTLNDSNPNSRTRYGYWDGDTYKIVANATDVPTGIDSTELQGGIIHGGTGIKSGSYKYGGGVYVETGTFTMYGGTIAGNITNYGGGVCVFDGGSFTMYGGSITGNKATTDGGGVCLFRSSARFTMEDGIITDNSATRYGGGVYMFSNAGTCTFTMNDGAISGNTATDGGGVYVHYIGAFTMNSGTISGNTATSTGGGVHVNTYCTFTMNDGTISTNTASTGNRIYLNNANATFKLYISPTRTSSIAGPIYTDDDDNFDMTVHTAGNVTIDGGTATSKNKGDIEYFTGTTWTFEQSSIDFSTIITQPVTGTTLPTTTTVTDSLKNTHNVTVEWSPSHTTAQADTVYTATVTFTDSTLENDQVINTNAGVKVDNQVVTLVFPATEKDTSNAVSIVDAKFYSGQLWDTQRSPAYPNTNSTFRLWSLKSPYDHYLKTFDMSNGEYVKFELVSNTEGVMTLASLNDTSLINAFNSYSNSSNSNDGVLVREVLYNANGTEKEVLSDYGLVWALGDEGFLYTAFSGYLKYSGGVGTYVTMDARTSNDTIVYVPESNDPLSQTDIEDAEIATKDGDTTTPSNTTFDLYGKVIDTGETEVGSATVTITYDGYTYTATTNADGYFVIPNVTYNPSDDTYTATVQTTGDKLNDYSGTIADKSDPIVLLYDSGVAGTSTVTSIYTVTIENDGVGKGSAYSTPSGTVSVIPGESLSVVFGNTVDGYSITSVSNGTKVDENIYKVSPTSDVTITATWQESPITNLDLTSYVTAPVKKEVPNTTDIEDDQYTGTISWSPNVSVYDANTVYTATVTLTAKDSYTLTGVASNSFTYTDATSVENSADSGVVTIVFPATVDKDDLTASDFKFTEPSNTIYDGSEKAATVESSNVVDGTITVTYTSSDPAYSSTTPPTEVGTYEVSVNVKDDSDYKDVSGLTDVSWKFEITKATHANETTTGSAKYGNEGSVDLSAWYGLEGGSLTLDAVTDSNGILMTGANISGEKLEFEFKDDETLVGKTATALIIVSSSNYKDFELTVTLEVLDKLSPNAVVANYSKTYDGTAVTVEDLEKSSDVDGTWSISSSVTNVSENGIYTILFTPSNTDDYATDSVDVLITIVPKTISDSDFDLTSVVDQVYTGSEILPAITSTLVVDADYTVTYANNINVSTDKAKITITAQGNYTGSVEVTFSITAKEITITDVEALDREYDGTTLVTILGTLNGVVAGDNVSYSATGTVTDGNYGNTKGVSDIVFILTGKDAGNYEIISQPSNDLGINVDITLGSISDVTISGVDGSYIETGSAIIPTVVVKDQYGNILIEGTDYIIEIKDNIDVGTAIITIKGTGNGNYDDGEKEFTFAIVKDSSDFGDLGTDEDGLDSENVEGGSAPSTGDDTHIAYLILLALFSMLGIVFIERK